MHTRVMGRPALNINVAKKDRQELRTLLKGGVQQIRVVLRALALLQLAADASAPQIAKVIPLTPQAIRRLGHRYQQAGLDGALYEKQRPGAAEVLDANQKQRIIAMVCSDPPEHPSPQSAHRRLWRRNGYRSLGPLYGPLHAHPRKLAQSSGNRDWDLLPAMLR